MGEEIDRLGGAFGIDRAVGDPGEIDHPIEGFGVHPGILTQALCPFVARLYGEQIRGHLANGARQPPRARSGDEDVGQALQHGVGHPDRVLVAVYHRNCADIACRPIHQRGFQLHLSQQVG